MLDLGRGLRRDDIVDLEIKDVTARGLGVGRVEVLVGPQKEMQVFEIFVRKAIPGDQVQVLIEKQRRRRCTGSIQKFLTPSPLRITARCPHFGRREEPGKGCGGCTFQSVSYRHQLAIKERMIKDRFKEAGVDPGLVLPVRGMDEPWYYRNKMEFSFGDDADRQFALGLFPTGYRHEILNLQTCYLQSEFTGDFLPRIRRWAAKEGFLPYLNSQDRGFLKNLMIREGKRTGERLLEVVTTPVEETLLGEKRVSARDAIEYFVDQAKKIAEGLGESFTSIYWTRNRVEKGSPTTWEEELLFGKETLREALELPGGRRLQFEIHPRAFFQPNTLGAEILYGEAIEKGGLSDQVRGKTVLDLYCGTGTIGLSLAPYAEKVLGIELQRDAVANARKNAATNEIGNVEFFAGDVGAVLGSQEFQDALGEGSVDLVVVDPPRSGLFPEAIREILRIGAPTLVYVSCNPESLAKNLVDLSAGGYQLEAVQPVDMFPQTFHVETVALLRRRED